MKKSFNVEKAQAGIIEAITHRITHADNDNQADKLRTELKFFSGEHAAGVLKLASNYEIDFAGLAKSIKVLRNESKEAFLAVYALQKVRKALYALAQGSKSGFDGYTNSILFNLAALQHINNKEGRMALCKAIEYTELEQVQGIKRLLNCSEGTASTQASSTRMMLRALGIANVTKQKTGDTISFTDSPAAAAVVTMYAGK